MSSTTKKRPSRKEIRLQREAAERVESAEDLTDSAPTAEIEPVKGAQPSALRSRPSWPELTRGTIATATASLATLAMVGSAASVIAFSGIDDALAAQGPTEPEQATISTIEPTVPDSLKKADGAADSARYFGLERELSGATVQCDVQKGANSLVSAFVDDEQYVVNPMSAGSYNLSSSFGWRYDPFTRTPSQHLGEDFAAPVGTPIYAMADGSVIHVGEGIDGRSANLIVIAHEIDGEKYTSWHVHMYDDGVHVKLGDEVKAGQHIGDVGSNGRSTGPHLHFEIHEGHGLSSEDGSTDHILNPLETLAKLGAVDVSELC